MKRYFVLTLHYCFFISALLFLPLDIAIFVAGFLISILLFENIFFTVLPLALCFYFPLNYTYILLAVFVSTIILYPFCKKNRYYALASYLLTSITTFVVLYFLNGFSTQTIGIMLLLLILYSGINLLHVYQKQNDKTIIIPYSQKLIYLTIILGYFFIIYLYSSNKYLMYFLFMQLFLISDFKYNLIFVGIYTLLLTIKDYTQLSTILYPTAISFLPISLALTLDFKGYLWIFFLIYSILVNLTLFKTKRLTIENDYINSLFYDFNKYINELNNEYSKNNRIKEIKEQKLEEISTDYCQRCSKNTLCKTKLDKRYSFLSGAMLGLKQNVYDCPYYNRFCLNTNFDNVNKSFEYSAIKSLAFELSFLYNQSLALKDDYDCFITLLANYGYDVGDLDINLSSSSLYFSIELAKPKPIIEDLLLRCAYKAFGEQLELKVAENRIYFFKKPVLKISYAHTVLAKSGNLMSGDNYYIKKDYNNSYIFALSDGMGSGYNAYTESLDALKTIASLSKYHFRIKTILRLLEDIYELRSNYDRYATLDFLAIDTANKKLNLYKMGSTTTYILHNNQLLTYENQTLPLKLDEINSSYDLDLYSGDYIFLLSDGISDFISNDEFYSLVSKGQKSADEVCYNIIDYIKRKENNKLKDDLSLIVIKAI